MRFEKFEKQTENIGEGVMQLSRYVVLENNEHSSNFPSCDIGLFHS